MLSSRPRPCQPKGRPSRVRISASARKHMAAGRQGKMPIGGSKEGLALRLFSGSPTAHASAVCPTSCAPAQAHQICLGCGCCDPACACAPRRDSGCCVPSRAGAPFSGVCACYACLRASVLTWLGFAAVRAVPLESYERTGNVIYSAKPITCATSPVPGCHHAWALRPKQSLHVLFGRATGCPTAPPYNVQM